MERKGEATKHQLAECFKELMLKGSFDKRKQVYTGIYRFADHELVTVSRQKAIAVEELIRELNALGEAVVFLGDGVTVYQEMLKENMQVPYSFAPTHLNKQRAGAVGALAEK